MFSQPRYVILLIFIGIVFMFTGVALFLVPLLGMHSSIMAVFLLMVGFIALILAGCLSRR